MKLILINAVVFLLLLESTLRVQQSLGPLVDLEMNAVTLDGLSDELNHRPVAGSTTERHPVLGNIAYVYDEDGIRRPSYGVKEGRRVRILFSGDSFMQGYDLESTIPFHFVTYLHSITPDTAIEALNAGYSSYSPSIFIPQMRHLLPKVQPDLLVIDIDETDLFDDYVRYRFLLRRNEQNFIVGVRRSENNFIFNKTLRDIGGQFLFMRRFVSKLYFTRIEMPRRVRSEVGSHPFGIFEVPAASYDEAQLRFKNAIDYFESIIEELTMTALGYLKSPSKLIFIHHPHLEHLSSDDRGSFWNSIVAETIQRVAARHNVIFYDATADLRRHFGSTPKQYYLPADMHFNREGLKHYSIAVAKKLEPLVERAFRQQ